MKTICFLAPSLTQIGGIATWYQNISIGCKGVFKTFQVDTSISEKEYNSKNRFLKLFLKFKRLNKNLREFKRIVNTNKIDVVHICTSGGFGFYRDFQIAKYAKKNNIRTILHLHFGRMPEILNDKGKEYNLFKKISKKTDAIIAIDKRSFNSIKSFFDNTFYINNPVVESDNKYDKNSNEITFIGTLNHNKGVPELLEAFDAIKERYQNIKLNIIGPLDKTEPDIEAIVKKYTNDKSIIFYGQKDADFVKKILAKSLCLVLPSRSEGMPYSILEAMSLSIPIISTNAGSIQEVASGCGFIIDKNYLADDLSSALISMILSDKKDEFSKNCKKKIKSEYAVDAIIEKMSDVWFNNVYE